MGGLPNKLFFLSILLNFDVNRVLLEHVNRNFLVEVRVWSSNFYEAVSSLFGLFLGERMSSFPPSGQGSGGDGGAALDLTNYGDTQQYYETYEQ